MKSNGLKFNGKHSYWDYGLLMESKSIQPPSKKKIKADVPGMNGSYDFSTIASGGEIVYTERSITVRFGLPTKSKTKLYILYTKVLQWLEDTPKNQLIFDDVKGYYYIAEIENMPTFDEVFCFGKLEVTFVAESFKTSLDFIGNDIWDTFNFLEDYMQTVNYTVYSTLTVTVYNKGRLIVPIINVSANMTVLVGSKTYNLVAGDNKVYGLKLQNGANELIFNGNGTAKVIFRAVSL